MYKGLKKRYTREEYVKLTLIKKANKCYFCLHNSSNYNISFTNKMDLAARSYFETLCQVCINRRGSQKYSYFVDNFKTLYDWEENNVEGANNV